MVFLYSYVGQSACQPARGAELSCKLLSKASQRSEVGGQRAEVRSRPALHKRAGQAEFHLKWRVER